ncbi:sugar ABC transporter substrate-binding protein [Streptomyces sp. NPDC060085]|uniref:sugar ABC transporter substrate-binding protein n=1 Tax=Streptomyces sp. NPDC060085 TaxID=3347054 RepID=UPI0036620B35
MKIKPVIAALVTSGILFVAGCQSSGTGDSSSEKPRNKVKIIAVTHGQAADPYWSVVKRGVDEAARDLGVSVSYQSPQTFDIAEMQKLLDAAIAQKPDGIVVSLPDVDALAPGVKKAVASGIPVVSIDAGEDEAPKLGVMTHVGASQFDSGKQAGERLARMGVKKIACINHEQGNSSLDVRCEGLRAGLKGSGGSVTNVAINGKDPTDSQQRMTAIFKSGSYDAAVALGSLGVEPMLAAAKASDFKGKLASFDLSPEILQAVDDGKMTFAIDAQQYLMGYLPVMLLAQHAEYGLTPSEPLTPTGPAFVTKENAAKIIQLAKEGVR